MTNSNSINDDALELEKFNALAHQWWDKEGPFKPLHDMNPHRLQWVQSQVSMKDKNLLDIGCGGGIFCESAAKMGADVTGIDQAKKVIQIASIHAAAENININYQQSNIALWANEHREQYDIVTAFEMLEHVPDPAAVIQNCFELVKPGGHVFFSTINRNLKSFLFAIVGAEYVLNLLPKGTHHYAQLIRPSELAKWCTDTGFELQKTSGIQYNPFTKKFKLTEHDMGVNYFLSVRKPSCE